jgi:3-hydroxyisobutyrate dehydrogenase
MTGRALWLQTATIGPRWAEEFATRAEQAGLAFIDAPVIGSIPAAVARRLTFFAAGPAELREIAEPLFRAMGERTYWYDAPGDGERIKLAINGWIISLAQLAVESLAVTEELGHDPRQFLEILDGHFDGSPLLQVLGAAILDGDFGGGLRVPLAHKDLSLLIDAAEESGGVSLAIAPAVRARLQEAIELGYGDRGATATWFVARAGSGRAAASAAGRTGPRRSEPSR